MTKMYKAGSNSTATASAEDAEITKIQGELSELQNKVLKQNEINRDLLRVHIDRLRNQISGFKNPYKNNRSVYASAQPQKIATMIHVEA